MKTLLALVLASVTLSAQPAPKPNFTGNWTMNTEKSEWGAVPPPSLLVRKISHAEPELIINEEQRGAAGEGQVVRKYVTDGSPMTFTSQGAEVKSSATWKGDTLLVVSTVDIVGLTYNDAMSLSPDGRSMTSQLHISSPAGDVDVTVVFDKQ